MTLGKRLLSSESTWLGVLFVASFCLRWTNSGGELFDDESWYFYLSRNFGFEPGAASEHPWFHVLNRPLFYGLFHLSTYGGVVGFRLFGCLVGAAAPPLAYAAACALGSARWAAAFAAICVALLRPLVFFSAHPYPDVTAVTFALAACWAAGKGEAKATLWFSLASVLCKESFIAVPPLVTFLRLYGTKPRPLRLDREAVWTLALPTAYVAAVTGIGLYAGGRMQGWGRTPLTEFFAREMGVGPEVWPLLIWLALRREARTLALWLALPTFYLLWNKLLGRGLSYWYAIGPSALSALAAAQALTALRAYVGERKGARWSGSIAAVLALACFVSIPMRAYALARVTLASLHGWPDYRALSDLEELLKQQHAERILVVNCFWADRYSHLRAAEPGTFFEWHGPSDEAELLSMSRVSDLIVVCNRFPSPVPVLSKVGRVTARYRDYVLISPPTR